MTSRSTRGSGFLERFLSKQRSKVAKGKICGRFSRGRVLDIGCGLYPYFLSTLDAFDKYGIDQSDIKIQEGMTLCKTDLNAIKKLPFEDGYFDAVSALALIEHLDPAAVPCILQEARRVLKKDGILVLTTPADWTEKILKYMAALNLVSKQEISEHKSLFNSRSLRELLRVCGFRNIKIDSFELGMNLLAVADK